MERLNSRKQLSNLEARVIAAIATGASDIETAAQLYIYEGSVRRVIRSAMRKWGVADRGQLLSLWRESQPSCLRGLHETTRGPALPNEGNQS